MVNDVVISLQRTPCRGLIVQRTDVCCGSQTVYVYVVEWNVLVFQRHVAFVVVLTMSCFFQDGTPLPTASLEDDESCRQVTPLAKLASTVWWRC